MDIKKRQPAALALAARIAVSPVLPTVAGPAAVEQYARSSAKICLLHRIPLTQIERTVADLSAGGREAIVNIDSIAGLGRDRSALDFLSEIGVSGVMSSRIAVLQYARQQKFLTVQSLFVAGASTITSNAEAVTSTRANLVALSPSPVLAFMTREERSMLGSIIASGFIRTREDVQAAISAGVLAAATSNVELWDMVHADLD